MPVITVDRSNILCGFLAYKRYIKRWKEGYVMLDELKSCPFCGSKAELHSNIEYDTHIVECTNNFCMASYMIGMKYDTEEEANLAWNRRF